MRKRHLVCVAATEQKGVYERSALDAELRGYRFMTFDFHALGRKEQAWQQGVHSITFFFFLDHDYSGYYFASTLTTHFEGGDIPMMYIRKTVQP